MRFTDPSPPPALLERLYRRLLRLYPAAFRRRFGADMGDVFRDLCRAAGGRRGLRGVAWVAARAYAEIPWRALEAWRETRREAAAEHPRWTPRTDRREDVMSSFAKDLAFTFRTLAKSPGFTVVAVLSLALGIGANTAIFSVLNAVFLRPLPYPEPGRLVMVAPDLVTPEGEVDELGVWSYPYFEAFREHNEVFTGVAAFSGSALNLTGLATPDRVRVEYVTASYFPLLGLEARLGRTFLPQETAAEAETAVALLQDGTWRRRFGADPQVLGRTVHLNGVEHTIVGVLPPGFDGLTGEAELWVPFPMTKRLVHSSRLSNPHGFWHNAVARLAPDVTLEEARASFPALAAAMTEAVPLHPAWADNTMTLAATPLAEARIDQGIRQPLVLLLAAVSLVLAIACANVAVLLLSRAVARRREIGVRVALGAGRGRLIRQFLTESAVLGLLAAAAGVAVAGLGLRGLKAALPTATPGRWTRYAEAVDGAAITIDGRVLLYAVALSLAAALVFGLAPALGVRRTDAVSALASPGSPPSRGVGLRRLGSRSLLVVVQLALAVVLLVGAGLLLRSLDRMRHTDPGFDAPGVLTAHLYLPRDAYQDKAGAFFEELLDRLAALPGVESVSQAISLPLLSNSSSTILRVQGEDDEGVEKPVGYHIVGPDHLRTLGIPLIRGRTFRDSDRAGAPSVVLVNQALAGAYFGGENPIGRRIWLGMGFANDEWAEIVGVVGDVRYGRIDERVGPDAYVSARQWPERGAYLLLATAGDPLALVGGLRRAVSDLDPNLPVYSVATLAERTAESRSHARFLTLLLGTFAALALVLAATGIYGVMAYAVSSRTRELGIRMALGARRPSILALVLTEGLALAAAGLAAGLAAAYYLTRFLASQLYGVGTLDPPTLAATAAALLLVALAASLWPARRAGSVDPMTVLRNE